MSLARRSIAAVAASLLCYARESAACSAIAIGKDASATGFPMVAHSEDSGPATNDVRLTRVPRKQWPEGSLRPLYVWNAGYPRVVSTVLDTPDYAPFGDEELTEPIGHIAQVRETWAYWDMDYGMQNEWGLSMGESTCTARTVGWPANVPHGHNRAGIEDLSKIALERCTTARCAVETMGKIAVEQGFYSADSGAPSAPAYAGSSECLIIADASPGEIWIFDIMTGKNNASAIWAAERVPDNHVTIAANTFTIRTMNLSDSRNFLYSPHVSALAEEMGWWSRDKDASPDLFDFMGAYGYTPPAGAGEENNIVNYYSSRRMWRIFSLLSPAEGAKLDPERGNLPHEKNPYPNSVPAPRRSLTRQNLMDAYRDHYEGTAYDLTKGMAAGPFGNPNRGPTPPGLTGLWERAVSMHRATWSFVLEARPHRRSMAWFGWDAPHSTAYLPLYAAATESAPESYHSHDGHMSKFSNKVAFWAWNVASQVQNNNFQLINADVLKNAHRLEKEGAQAVESWEAEAEKAESEDAAIALLTQRSNAFVHKAVEDWWQFSFSLFAKFHHYGIVYNESGTNGEVWLNYPEWWLKSPEVGFTSWSPKGPYHGILLDAQVATREPILDEKLPIASGIDLTWVVMIAICSSCLSVVVAHKVGFRRGQKSASADMQYYYAMRA